MYFKIVGERQTVQANKEVNVLDGKHECTLHMHRALGNGDGVVDPLSIRMIVNATIETA